jgi:class 3 adenylate cyclase
MTPQLPTGTVTFLFSDIEGSTRLLHELGPRAQGPLCARTDLTPDEIVSFAEAD